MLFLVVLCLFCYGSCNCFVFVCVVLLSRLPVLLLCLLCWFCVANVFVGLLSCCCFYGCVVLGVAFVWVMFNCCVWRCVCLADGTVVCMCVDVLFVFRSVFFFSGVVVVIVFVMCCCFGVVSALALCLVMFCVAVAAVFVLCLVALCA